MKISVIVSTLNSADYLETCLRSIIDQRYPDLELIIIDGGSTDGTLDIIKKYKTYICHWESGRDTGIYHAWNKGLMCATGDVVTFLGSDDYYFPGALEAIREAFQRYPDVALIYGEADTIDLEGKTIQSFGAKDVTHQELATVRCFIPSQAAFFRRSIVPRVGLFETRYKWSSDWEYWLRITEKLVCKFIDKKLAVWRINPHHVTYKVNKGYYRRYIETIKVSLQYGRTPFAPLVLKNIQGILLYPLYKQPWIRAAGRRLRAFVS